MEKSCENCGNTNPSIICPAEAGVIDCPDWQPLPEKAEPVCEWEIVDRDEFDRLVCIVGCTGKGRSNDDFVFCPYCGKPIKEKK